MGTSGDTCLNMLWIILYFCTVSTTVGNGVSIVGTWKLQGLDSFGWLIQFCELIIVGAMMSYYGACIILTEQITRYVKGYQLQMQKLNYFLNK
jgi:hypothetical protein